MAGLAVLGSAMTGSSDLRLVGAPAQAEQALTHLLAGPGPALASPSSDTGDAHDGAVLVVVTPRGQTPAQALDAALRGLRGRDVSLVWLLHSTRAQMSATLRRPRRPRWHQEKLSAVLQRHGLGVAARFGAVEGHESPTHLVPLGDERALRWYVDTQLRAWGGVSRALLAMGRRAPTLFGASLDRALLIRPTGTRTVWPGEIIGNTVVHLGGGATAGRAVLSGFTGGDSPERHVKVDLSGSPAAHSAQTGRHALQRLAQTSMVGTVARSLGTGRRGLAQWTAQSHLEGTSLDVRWQRTPELWHGDVMAMIDWAALMNASEAADLAHGDLWAGNIVRRESLGEHQPGELRARDRRPGGIGVVDWEGAHSGDQLEGLLFFLVTSVMARHDVILDVALAMLFSRGGRHRELAVHAVGVLLPDIGPEQLRQAVLAALSRSVSHLGHGGVPDPARQEQWDTAIGELQATWDRDGSPWDSPATRAGSPGPRNEVDGIERVALTGETVEPAALKVLHVLDSFSFGGAENLIVELGRTRQNRFALQVASLTPTGTGRDAMHGRLEQVGLRPRHLGVRRLLDPVGMMRLVRALRGSDADVVHAHLGYSATLVPLAARLAGKPVVATLHLHPGDLPRGEWIKERLSVRIPARLGRVVFVSGPAFQEFSRRHGPATETWRMIPNGVDLERFAPPVHDAPERSTVLGLDLPPDAVVWAMVAALRPEKGHEELVQAWARVVQTHPHAHLLVVGDGEHREAVRARVEQLGLNDSVHLLGRREDIPRLLHVIDGVVSASHTEALPTALIEAASAGLPVVTTAAGGSVDIVRDGVTGHVVPIHDVEALAAALTACVGDPARAQEMGRAGRRHVQERYSMAAWVAALDTLYRDVLGQRPDSVGSDDDTTGRSRTH